MTHTHTQRERERERERGGREQARTYSWTHRAEGWGITPPLARPRACGLFFAKSEFLAGDVIGFGSSASSNLLKNDEKKEKRRREKKENEGRN